MTPDTLTYQEAKRLLDPPDWIYVNRRLLGRHEEDGGDVDHWQDGKGYRGKQPARGSRGAQFYMDELKQRYVTDDVCSDVIDHRQTGVLSKAPNMAFEISGEAPTTEEEERQKAFEAWWADHRVGKALAEHAVALDSEKRSVLRLRVVGQSNESGQIDASTPLEALQHIYVEQSGRDEAQVHHDRETKQDVGVFVTAGDRDQIAGGERQRAEICYLDAAGRTVLRIVRGPVDTSASGYARVAPPRFDAEEEGSTPLDLGGRLLMREDEGRLVLSESMRSQQFALNTIKTWVLIVNEKEGFPELHLTDIDPPKDDEGNPVSPKRGPGVIQYHVSIPSATTTRSGEEVEQSARPNVQQFAGASTQSLREDAADALAAIYRAAKQRHRAISGDATASGKSRIQARSDFVQDLGKVKTTLDASGTWLMETTWALAEALAGQPHSETRASFDCILDAGPITGSERSALRDDVDAGHLSLRRSLSQRGVDDPEAEVDQIRQEQEEPVTKGQAETVRAQQALEADAQYARERSGIRARLERRDGERADGDPEEGDPEEGDPEETEEES